MVGSGTALADDPELTCRLPGLEDRSPVRIVLDGRLRLPPSSRLARTARAVPTWVITRARTPPKRRADARARCGVEVLTAGDGRRAAGSICGEVLAALAARGLTRVLVEGGARAGRSAAARRVWSTAWSGSRRRC